MEIKRDETCTGRMRRNEKNATLWKRSEQRATLADTGEKDGDDGHTIHVGIREGPKKFGPFAILGRVHFVHLGLRPLLLDLQEGR